MRSGLTDGTVPDKVVNFAYDRAVSPMAAWREHFGLTQADVAARIGITQAAYAQMERVKQPRKATLEKSPRRWGLKWSSFGGETLARYGQNKFVL